MTVEKIREILTKHSKKAIEKMFKNLIGTEQYFQLIINGYSKIDALKLIVKEMKENNLLDTKILELCIEEEKTIGG